MANFWYVCLVFLKTIGLAPISWQNNSPLKNLFVTSPQCTIYNVVLTILYTLIYVYFIFNEVLSSTGDSEFFTLNHIFIITAFFVVFFAVMNFTLRQRTVAHFCNELGEIDQWLEVFNRHYKHPKFDAKLKMLTVCNMFCCLWFPIAHAR